MAQPEARPSLAEGEFTPAAGGIRRVSVNFIRQESQESAIKKLPGDLRQVRRLGRSLVRRTSLDPPDTPVTGAEVLALSRKTSSVYLSTAGGGCSRSQSFSHRGTGAFDLSGASRARRAPFAKGTGGSGGDYGLGPRDRLHESLMNLNEFGEIIFSPDAAEAKPTPTRSAANAFFAREYKESDLERNPMLRRLRDIYKKVKLAEAIVRTALPVKPSRVRSDLERQKDLLELEKAKLILYVGRRYNVEKRITDMLDEVMERERFLRLKASPAGTASSSATSAQRARTTAAGSPGSTALDVESEEAVFVDADGREIPRARLLAQMEAKFAEINADFLSDRSRDDFNMGKIRAIIETVERETEGVSRECTGARRRCYDEGVDVEMETGAPEERRSAREQLDSAVAANLAAEANGGKRSSAASALLQSSMPRRKSSNIKEAPRAKDFYMGTDKRVGELLETVSNFKDMCWLIESLDLEYSPVKGGGGGGERYAELLGERRESGVVKLAKPPLAHKGVSKSSQSRSRDGSSRGKGEAREGEGEEDEEDEEREWDDEVDGVDPFFLTTALAEAGVTRDTFRTARGSASPALSDPSLVPFSLEQSETLSAVKHTEGLNLLGFMFEALPDALRFGKAPPHRPSTAPSTSPVKTLGKKPSVALPPPLEALDSGADEDDEMDADAGDDPFTNIPLFDNLAPRRSILESPGRPSRTGGGFRRRSTPGKAEEAEVIHFPATLFDVLKNLYKQYDYGHLIDERRSLGDMSEEKTAEEYIAEMEARMQERRRRQSEELIRGARQREEETEMSMVRNMGVAQRKSIPSMVSLEMAQKRSERIASIQFNETGSPLARGSPTHPKDGTATTTGAAAADGALAGTTSDDFFLLPMPPSRSSGGRGSRPSLLLVRPGAGGGEGEGEGEGAGRRSSEKARQRMADFTNYSERILFVQVLEDCGLIFSVLGKLKPADAEKNKAGKLPAAPKKPIQYEHYLVRVVNESPAGTQPSLAEVRVLRSRLKNLTAEPCLGFRMDTDGRLRTMVKAGGTTRTVLTLRPTKKKKKVNFSGAFAFAGARLEIEEEEYDTPESEQQLLQRLAAEEEETAPLINSYSSHYHLPSPVEDPIAHKRHSLILHSPLAGPPLGTTTAAAAAKDAERPAAAQEEAPPSSSPKAKPKPKKIATRREPRQTGGAANTDKAPASPPSPGRLPVIVASPTGDGGPTPESPKAKRLQASPRPPLPPPAFVSPFTPDDEMDAARPPERLEPLLPAGAAPSCEAETQPGSAVTGALVDPRPVEEWGRPHAHTQEDAMANNLVALSALQMGDGSSADAAKVKHYTSLENVVADDKEEEEEAAAAVPSPPPPAPSTAAADATTPPPPPPSAPAEAQGPTAASSPALSPVAAGAERSPADVIAEMLAAPPSLSPSPSPGPQSLEAQLSEAAAGESGPTQTPPTMEELAAHIMDTIAEEEGLVAWTATARERPRLAAQLVSATRLARAPPRQHSRVFSTEDIGSVPPPSIVVASRSSLPFFTVEETKHFANVGGVRYDLTSPPTASPVGGGGGRPSFALGGDASGSYAAPGSPLQSIASAASYCTHSRTRVEGGAGSGTHSPLVSAGAVMEMAERQRSVDESHDSDSTAGGQERSRLQSYNGGDQLRRPSAHEIAVLAAREAQEARRASRQHPQQQHARQPSYVLTASESEAGAGGSSAFPTPLSLEKEATTVASESSALAGDPSLSIGAVRVAEKPPDVVVHVSSSTGRTHVLLPPELRDSQFVRGALARQQQKQQKQTQKRRQQTAGADGGGEEGDAASEDSEEWQPLPQHAVAVAHVSDVMHAIAKPAGGGLGGVAGAGAGSSGSPGTAPGAASGGKGGPVKTEMEELQEEARALYMQDPERYAAVIDDLVRLAAQRLQEDVGRFAQKALPFDASSSRRSNNNSQMQQAKRPGIGKGASSLNASTSSSNRVSSVVLELGADGQARSTTHYSSTIPVRGIINKNSSYRRPAPHDSRGSASTTTAGPGEGSVYASTTAAGRRSRRSEVVSRVRVDGEETSHHTEAGKEEIERILFEQLQAKLLLEAVLSRMRTLWAEKQIVAEASKKEAMRRTFERGMDVAWEVQKYTVINLNKMINLLDRRTHRVRGGWVPFYSDTNVLTDSFGNPLNSAISASAFRGQQQLRHAMCLAKRRKLLPLRLVRREVQDRWNHHLLFGYKREVLRPGTQLIDSLNLAGSKDLYAWRPTRKYRGLTRYPDCETREDQLRYARRLQRAAPFQHASKMYSPRLQREADLPFPLH